LSPQILLVSANARGALDGHSLSLVEMHEPWDCDNDNTNNPTVNMMQTTQTLEVTGLTSRAREVAFHLVGVGLSSDDR